MTASFGTIPTGKTGMVLRADKLANPTWEYLWQPIETAPKDGKVFLAFTADFENGVRFNEHVQEAEYDQLMIYGSVTLKDGTVLSQGPTTHYAWGLSDILKHAQ